MSSVNVQGSCGRCTQKLCEDSRQSRGRPHYNLFDFKLFLICFSCCMSWTVFVLGKLAVSLSWMLLLGPCRWWAFCQRKALVLLVMDRDTLAPSTHASTQNSSKSWSQLLLNNQKLLCLSLIHFSISDGRSWLHSALATRQVGHLHRSSKLSLTVLILS